MLRVIRKLKGFIALLFIATTVVAAIPNVAFAAPGNPSYCDSSIDRLTNAAIGTEVPVILVHGMSGKPSDWGSLGNPASFASQVNNIPGVAMAHSFGYDSSNWVDHPSSGPKLAKTIDCVARLSTQNGGKGKVIVIGYSMGGLMARDALSRRSTDGQRAIADEVGQVVTIGSPHIGANVWEWSVFNAGSPEMQRLPHFPAQTTVHTIAGDVVRVYYDRQGNEVKREQPSDDTLVSTLSAHAEYTIDFNKGGGQKTMTCEKKYTPIAWWYTSSMTAPCEHGQLIQNAANGVREDTVDAIKKYVAFLSTPPPTSKSLTIGGLTTTFDGRWENVGYGASGPGQDGSASDTTNGVPCTNCTTEPNPTVNAFIDIVNQASWCNNQSMLACAVDPSTVVGAAPPVTIGGRTPDSSARYNDSGYAGTSLVWCFNDEKVCVHYRRGVDTPRLEPSQALLDVFSRASWLSV